MKTKRDVQVIPPEKYEFIDNKDVVKRLNAELKDDLAEAPSHGLYPIEFKVVVLPQKAPTKIGSIELPDQVIEKDQHAAMEGDIVAVSPFAFTYDEWPSDARKPQIGDRVVFARYSGINVRGNDGVDYRVMNDKDIVSVRRAAK